MSVGTIYKIEFPNGKHYIGLTTTSLKQRAMEHGNCAKNGDTRCVYNALRKYNMVDTFELIEIDNADSLEELCEKEIRYIVEYGSYYMNGKGYNMTYGGEGTNGYVYTEEAKQRMSDARIKYFENNPAARQQLSELKTKYFANNPGAGKEHGERMTQFWANQEEREKQSERTTNYFKNQEARQQASERTTKHIQKHPEVIDKFVERMKHHWSNTENKKKRLDAMGKNKPFDVSKIDGTFIETFTYQYEAREYLQKEYNITTGIKISEVLNGSRRNSAGFVFTYK